MRWINKNKWINKINELTKNKNIYIYHSPTQIILQNYSPAFKEFSVEKLFRFLIDNILLAPKRFRFNSSSLLEWKVWLASEQSILHKLFKIVLNKLCFNASFLNNNKNVVQCISSRR